MEQTPVTTQPLPSLHNTEKLSEQSPELSATAMFPSNDNEAGRNIEKEALNEKNETLTEVTARFNSETGHYEEKENSEEEKEKRRQETRENVPDCCCVYVDSGDTFCMYYLCYWICDCFRAIGECTENCFEGCASCLSNCCEDGNGGNSDSGCLDCCNDGGDDCGDCLTGCLDCCTSCDCDCST